MIDALLEFANSSVSVSVQISGNTSWNFDATAIYPSNSTNSSEMSEYKIETERLRMRQLKTSDLDALHGIMGDSDTMLYYLRPYTRNEVQEFIKRMQLSYAENGFGLWALEQHDNKKFIGQCGITLQNIDNDMVPELGYHLNKEYWGKGFAIEAARACLEYGFSVLQLPEIYIHTYIKNAPSIRIAEGLGMYKIKEFYKYIASSGTTMQHIVFRIANQHSK